jgi:hypothetical protein
MEVIPQQGKRVLGLSGSSHLIQRINRAGRYRMTLRVGQRKLEIKLCIGAANAKTRKPSIRDDGLMESIGTSQMNTRNVINHLLHQPHKQIWPMGHHSLYNHPLVSSHRQQHSSTVIHI